MQLLRKLQQWPRVVQTAVLARSLVLIAYNICRGRNLATSQLWYEKLNFRSRRALLKHTAPARTCTSRIPLIVAKRCQAPCRGATIDARGVRVYDPRRVMQAYAFSGWLGFSWGFHSNCS
jgi:hypothetical protein